MRPLSPDEAELWARVASTIRPLSRDPKLSGERGGQPAAMPTVERGHRGAAAKVGPLDRPSPSALAGPLPRSGEVLHRAATLDGSWDKKLRSGTMVPDRVIDLHGMSLDSAWAAIDRGLDQAIAGGERVILLITGHHRPGEPPIQRGRIRAAVYDWLAASRHARDIAAVRGAHRRHGGGGSLYLILRRSPSRR